jgi:osmotically-inducible protein OsmY
MKSDSQLKIDVCEEIAWDPALNSDGIGVMVKDGVVTLSGHLDTYTQRNAAERAVRRVSGVRAIALELDVKLSPQHRRSDSEIAQAACAALDLNSVVPASKVLVEVENGKITLTGEVDWAYQLASAEQAVSHLMGVRAVDNRIRIKPLASGKDIAAQISAALMRHASREAKQIDVEVNGAVVTLRGKVHSLAERKAIIGTAFAAHGVSRVEDYLEVAT